MAHGQDSACYLLLCLCGDSPRPGMYIRRHNEENTDNAG
jgi:hypothetical protein